MQQYVIFNVLKEYCIPKEEEEVIGNDFMCVRICNACDRK